MCVCGCGVDGDDSDARGALLARSSTVCGAAGRWAVLYRNYHRLQVVTVTNYNPADGAEIELPIR